MYYALTKASIYLLSILPRAGGIYRASQKSSFNYLLTICLRNWRSLKVLNDTKVILNNQDGPLDSFRINLESFRTFRGLLFHKKHYWKRNFLEARYILTALNILGLMTFFMGFPKRVSATGKSFSEALILASVNPQ